MRQTLALAATTLLFGVVWIGPAFAASKSLSLTGSVGGNITAQKGQVDWTAAGTGAVPSCSETASGTSGSFVIGTGDKNSVTNSLCTDTQTSSWDIQAAFTAGPPGTPGASSWEKKAGGPKTFGDVTATATAIPGGTSTATTTFSTTGAVNFKTSAKITGAGVKDDASLSSVLGGLSLAEGSEAFYFDGSLLMSVDTELSAQNGAPAFISLSGLTILATSGELAGFSAEAVNTSDPTQDLSWSVTFDGSNLVVNGIDPSLFQTI